jgi:hypothetical protein
VNIFFYKITFLTDKEKIDLLFHTDTMNVHAFVETCYRGMYSWSTELRVLRTVSLWDNFSHFLIRSAYVTTKILFREPNGAKIPHFPTYCSLVAAVWMGMSPTFAAQPWRAHQVTFVFSALWRGIMWSQDSQMLPKSGNCSLSKPTWCNVYTIFFINCQCSTCFGRFICPSSGAQELYT